MVLDKEIKTQLAQYLNLLESDIVLQTDLGDDDNSRKVKEFLDEIVAMSDRISLESTHLKRQPSFGIAQKGQKSRVIFSGLPMGHEFTSFILALLQVSGRPPKVDEDIIERIKKIDKTIDLETYVSLTCHNCPDVVQAFNIMAVLNPNITHTMIEGGMYQDEVKAKGIMSVPTVYKDQEEFTSGRATIEQLVEKLDGPLDAEAFADIIKSQLATGIEKKELIEVTLANGAVLQAKTAILALGAKWRNINVPGEDEFRNKGVTYCPHCDGPLFEGKDVAVIGGGNSGLEAALDLAGITKHVTVLEFLPELKADQVLQERAAKTDNLTILKNVATKEILGQDHVTGLSYIERDTNEEKHLDLEGVFVQIGLVPSTAWLKDSGIELNERQEIIVDKFGSTNIPGIFAAGDCTDSAYKQIIISMGSGATAAIGAFDYLIRQ